ncbi:glycogen debranching N-terminal domain-containing protein [Haloarcula pelagica]|uniref:amylo-alpha-1,6-glucosidase n=2 Tax=Haloarcula TaxID=2237 RepID=UPI0024C43911|nr:glycogen debranching N-terminal domain-containing protein [Halomicroarcula sp. YJ-61-S]
MGSTFLVTDSEGRPTRDHDGFYYRDVRHLDDYALSVDEDLESLEVVDVRPGERLLHLGTPLETGSRKLHVSRRQFVADGLFEDLTISNLSGSPVKTSLTLRLGSRFDDLFEVRGMVADLDRTIDVDRHETGLTFRYAPSDAAFSRSVSITLAHVADIAIDVNSRANRVDATIEADLTLAPGESRTVPVAVTVDGPAPAAQQLQVARKTVRDRAEDWTEAKPIPEHSGSWTSVLRESHENLLELQLPTEHGPILAAGVPWFATAFGRDSIIAAFQSLGVDTGLAKGTCRYLGAHQADTYDAERDAEPGKILHEIRCGELTARELVPHRPYYGTVDATPLFVVLVHETWRRTGDDEFLAELWPNVQRALEWLDDHAKRTDGGLLAYGLDSQGSGQLRHQGWKDSGDGIVYPDGSYPSGSLAVAEVQGYEYDAKRRGAELASEMGERQFAATLEKEAERTKQRFDEAFWLSDEEFYAVAVEEGGDAVPSITTNPGHCLWSGIVPETRADAVVDRLLAPEMFTGWGIRTLSASHDAYNPQSYHLGSVWPHDNSIVALGMARYGRQDAASQVAEGLLEAAQARGNDRLPELFAGFERSETDVPVTYGEACEPQAWAAAAPLACLQAIQGTPVEPPREIRH